MGKKKMGISTYSTHVFLSSLLVLSCSSILICFILMMCRNYCCQECLISEQLKSILSIKKMQLCETSGKVKLFWVLIEGKCFNTAQ